MGKVGGELKDKERGKEGARINGEANQLFAMEMVSLSIETRPHLLAVLPAEKETFSLVISNIKGKEQKKTSMQ